MGEPTWRGRVLGHIDRDPQSGAACTCCGATRVSVIETGHGRGRYRFGLCDACDAPCMPLPLRREPPAAS